MAVILYEFEALSLEAVSELTQSTPLELQAIIDGLAALIPVKQDPEPTPSVHASVVDFLADTSRCLDPRFQLSAQNSHNCLAQHCLTVMCERLNGVDLTQSGSDLLATNIWTTVLRYACRHWHSHLILADLTASKDLQDKFAEFCEKYLLTWLRVMCTWGHYPEMRIALQKLAHWYQVRHFYQIEHLLLTDQLARGSLPGSKQRRESMRLYNCRASYWPLSLDFPPEPSRRIPALQRI